MPISTNAPNARVSSFHGREELTREQIIRHLAFLGACLKINECLKNVVKSIYCRNTKTRVHHV